MIRIISGNHYGRTLLTPPGKKVRPTNNRARTALFNILGPWIRNKRVLELYAGAGSIGFECLSRGAEHVTFVENAQAAIKCLKKNAALLGEESNVSIIKYNVKKYINTLDETINNFDFIFADPPYKDANTFELLNLIAESSAAHDDSIVVFEYSAKYKTENDDVPKEWLCYKTSKYGKAMFSFFRKKSLTETT